MVLDLTPLTSASGEPPFDLDVGVEMTVEWMRREGLVDAKPSAADGP